MLKSILKLFSPSSVNEAQQQRALAMFRLLRQETVQSKLAMNVEQRAALERCVRAARKEVKRDESAAGDLSPDDQRRRANADRLRTAATVMEAVERENVLTPRQMETLRQLRCKRQGVLAFSDPEVLAALEMSPEQTAAVQTKLRDLDFGRRNPEESTEAQNSRRAMRRQSLEQVLATLNDAQKAKWAELSGDTGRRRGAGGGRTAKRAGQRPGPRNPGGRKRAARAARTGEAAESGEV